MSDFLYYTKYVKRANKSKNITFNSEMLVKTAKIHHFFKHGEKYNHKYNSSDYVLDSKSSFDFYNLVRGEFGGIVYISISDKISKKVIENKLMKAGLDFVRVFKRRPHEIISSNVNPTKKDKNNNYKMVNVWDYEKLFLYLDTFYFPLDTIMFIARNLEKVCNMNKLLKLKEHHSMTKRPISIHVQNFIQGIKNTTIPERNQCKSKLIYDVLRATQQSSNILFGGVAVEIQLGKVNIKRARKTEDVDILFIERDIKSFQEEIESINLKHSKIVKKPYEEGGAYLPFFVRDKSKRQNSKEKQITISLNNSISYSCFEELLSKRVVEQIDSIGYILSPEGLVSSLFSTSTRWFSTNGEWSHSLIKNLIDICLLVKYLEINPDRLKETYQTLERCGLFLLTYEENISRIKKIIDNDSNFHEDLMFLVKSNSLQLNKNDIKNNFQFVSDIIIHT